MKKILVLFLALSLFLTACAAPAAEPTLEPRLPTDQVVLPEESETPAPTDAPALDVTATSTTEAGEAGAIFTDLVRSVDAFSFKCAPSEVIFGVRSLDAAVTQVMFFYRVVDKNSSAAAHAMVDSRAMAGDKKGHFQLLFRALYLNENARFTNGWFEYQFVGLNKSNGIVGRSDKIVKQVTFTLGCP